MTFEEKLIQAQKEFEALDPHQKHLMRVAQRRSWVVGELMLEHPEMTRQEADEIYDKVVLGIGL